MFSLFASIERTLISQRTKEGLVAARARGKKLGNPRLNEVHKRLQDKADAFARQFAATVLEMRRNGASQRAIVAYLNEIGTTAPEGGPWSLLQVQKLLKRIENLRSENL